MAKVDCGSGPWLRGPNWKQPRRCIRVFPALLRLRILLPRLRFGTLVLWVATSASDPDAGIFAWKKQSVSRRAARNVLPRLEKTNTTRSLAGVLLKLCILRTWRRCWSHSEPQFLSSVEPA